MAFFLALAMEPSWGQNKGSQTDSITAEKLGNEVIKSVESGQSVQSTPYNSLYQSSVDNMMNSQKGQATAQILSQSLATAAETQSQTCDKGSDSGNIACATAGALLGMATLTQESSDSFIQPIQVAWSNVCQFSSLGCADEPPNPYSSVSSADSGFTYGKIDSVTQKLELEGYILNHKNGILKTPDGKTLDPNKRDSIKKALGESRTSQLMNKVKSLEAQALQRISRVSIKKYLSSLGLAPITENFKWGQGSSELSPSSLESGGKQIKPESTAKDHRNRSTLFKIVEGVPLGVASENIFEMITRRYRMKDQQNSFLKTQNH